MDDDRNVFNPKERRRVAEEMFREALRKRIDAWVEGILNDQSVRDRVVHGLFSGQYGIVNDCLRHEVREGVLRRVRKVTQEIVESMCLDVSVRVRNGAPDVNL